MASLEKAQQLLKAKGYTEAQIKEMQTTLDALAELLIDKFLADRQTDKNNK